MSLTYGFFNSVEGDRKYDAIQMSRIFDGIIRDGVFATIGNALTVRQNTGMTIAVGEGRAWFNHTWSYNDAPVVLTVADPHLLYDRIDTVVLEVNASQEVRANSLKIITGPNQVTPSTPKYATLINDSELGIYQYALAFVSVQHGTAQITNAMITNNVGMSSCPYVTGPLQVVNIDDLRTHWEAQFDEWFAATKASLLAEKGVWEGDWASWLSAIQTAMTGDKNSWEAAWTSWLAARDAERIDWGADFAAWFANLQNQLDSNQASHLQNEIDILTASNNVLLATIVSTGVADEFDFTNIPSGYKNLRLVGYLKDINTGGLYGVAEHHIRLNGDSGANYAEINDVTQQWVGWGSRTFLTVLTVVTNRANNAGYRNEYNIKFPSYDSSVTKKFAFVEELQVNDYGGNGNPSPSIGRYNYTDMWNSNSPITRIQITGTYVPDISVMRLYGCPF